MTKKNTHKDKPIRSEPFPDPRQATYNVIQSWSLRVWPTWGEGRMDRILPAYNVLFCRGGKGWLESGEQRIELSRSVLIVLAPETRFGLGAIPTNPPDFVQFHLVITTQSGQFPAVATRLNTVKVTDHDYFKGLFESLHEHATRGTHEDAAYAGTMAHVILREMRREQQRRQNPAMLRLERIRAHIDSVTVHRETIGELAKMAGLSQKYFTRQFRKAYGITPKGYQVRARMRHARYLLEEEGKSVSETAEALGYADPFLFSRQFTHITGKPPSTCRSYHGRSKIENVDLCV